jgi:opacity protein-like surface antigen
MNQVTKAVLSACVLALTTSPAAFAQGPLYRGLLSVNFGMQATSRTLNESGTFALYEETGTVEGSREVGSGPLFDASGAFKVWNNVMVGVGYSWFSAKGDVPLDVRVPDPLHFDRPRAATLTLADAAQTEQAVHLQVLFDVPLTEKIALTFGGGPSFYSVEQDVLDEVVAMEGDTLTVTGTTASVSDSAVGYNAGADLSYMFMERVGAGLVVRYSGATVKLPDGEGVTRDVKVGGFQVGGGLRFRF